MISAFTISKQALSRNACLNLILLTHPPTHALHSFFCQDLTAALLVKVPPPVLASANAVIASYEAEVAEVAAAREAFNASPAVGAADEEAAGAADETSPTALAPGGSSSSISSVPSLVMPGVRDVNKEHPWPEFDPQPIAAAIDAHRETLPGSEVAVFDNTVAPLATFVDTYARGRDGYAFDLVSVYLDRYIQVARYFATGLPPAETILELRSKEPTEELLSIARSHHRVTLKNRVVGALLVAIDCNSLGPRDMYVPTLRSMVSLSGKGHIPVVLQARRQLVRYQMQAFREQNDNLGETLVRLNAIEDVEERAVLARELANRRVCCWILLLLLFCQRKGCVCVCVFVCVFSFVSIDRTLSGTSTQHPF